MKPSFSEGRFSQTSIDHYKEAFSSFETAPGSGIASESISNALADCGVVFSPQDITTILLPHAPESCVHSGAFVSLLPFPAFLELLRVAMPLAPNRKIQSTNGSNNDDATNGKPQGNRRMTRRESVAFNPVAPRP
ncbi:Hypothetical protein, putative [Bodo saltans]|uniref:Uncharacterized protein n=1 Tax=Bodo saltans TaxID=75058 RepID=A0A0S4IT70_BODSA|nr:Hypothetical protein, putative [Bodo saltans]|eukprot:CUF01403.1 Hypothetical protein, putative [Bodo saltans]